MPERRAGEAKPTACGGWNTKWCAANAWITFDASGLNLGQKSPHYQAANRACQSLAAHAKR